MKNILTIFLLLTCGICFGQNLVLNGDFEQYDTCPNGLGQLYRATKWTSPVFPLLASSPDYLNSCTNSIAIGVPINVGGYELAHTGNGYSSICTAVKGNSNPNIRGNFREYLQGELSDTLVAGISYYIRFYVSACDSFNYVSNDIGVFFSTTAIHDSCGTGGCTLPFIPQFENPSSNDLSNRNGWTLVNGVYYASGGEKYIVIGNFKDSLNTNTTFMNWTTTLHKNFAIYYVDDVCVSTDSLACDVSTGLQRIKQNVDLSLFPNPFSTQLTFSFADNEQTTVSLYDFLGQQVLQQTFTNSTTINTDQLADGIYFYELRSSKGTLKTGKVVKL